jgi:hypothetical protein
MRPSTTKDNKILSEAYSTLSEKESVVEEGFGERGSINGLAHAHTAGPLEEGEDGGKFAGAKDITEVINMHTQETIKELQQMDAAEGEEPRSDEDYRLSVYEDLNDHLKYLFSDVAYG